MAFGYWSVIQSVTKYTSQSHVLLFLFFGNFIFELDHVLKHAAGQVLVPLALVHGVVALSKSS